jgi:hypothetical protein
VKIWHGGWSAISHGVATLLKGVPAMAKRRRAAKKKAGKKKAGRKKGRRKSKKMMM